MTLTNSQQSAINTIRDSLKDQKGRVFLLHGPAGSGKTEVYLKTARKALSNNQSSIILTPEIGLTYGLIDRFKEEFGDLVAVIHSGLTDKERTLEWEKIITGEKPIVVGTRIALFAPVKNLKLVILDEEYETTYKQEQNPRYHARTVAEFMAKELGITTVLASATPSVESYYKTTTGEFTLLKLEERRSRELLPKIEIIDMNTEPKSLLSQKLKLALKETLDRGEKAILFINRIGFFTYAMCRDCGKTINCPNCSTSLTYHFKEHTLKCGHCGLEAKANLLCPNCQSSSIAFMGQGTQRIEEEVGALFPNAKIVRIDRDSVTKKGSHEKLFAAFSEGNANILIGTQMVTKGIDAPNVTLVGVVSADSMLSVPDFRSAEHAFQQLSQVAGRSGRHNLPGKVFIQTNSPDHFAVKCAAEFDYEKFFKEEIKNREALSYPPFSKLINIIIHGKDEKTVRKITNDLRLFLLKETTYQILGPTKAVIQKLRGEVRYQILLKGKDITTMRKSLERILNILVIPIDVRIFVDVEPENLL